MKITPKVRERIGAEQVVNSLNSLTSFVQKNFDFKQGNVVLVGIQTRGAVLAERIAASLSQDKGISVPVGALDITLYRDDFSTSDISPVVGETKLNFDIDDKKIILIDDVLYTGRTIRAALDEIMDFGRPQSITLAVLIDRGHRELPIQADFSALKLSTKRDESVNLHLKETDSTEDIVICEPLKE